MGHPMRVFRRTGKGGDSDLQ